MSKQRLTAHVTDDARRALETTIRPLETLSDFVEAALWREAKRRQREARRPARAAA